MANLIQLKRGLKADLPTLNEAEPGYCTDTHELFIGDGAANHQVLMHDLFDAGTFLYAASDNTPQAKTRAEILALLSGQNGADFSMNSHKVTAVADPTLSQDAATKNYVDNLVAHGLTFHEYVLDKDTLTPPGTPGTGDRYWIGGTGTGDWAGHDYDIAEWDGAQWVFDGVTEGDTAYVDDEATFYFYNGTSLAKLTSAAGATAFTSLSDTPSSYSGEGGKLVRVNSTPNGLEFVSFASAYLEDSPSNGETAKAPTSNWAYDHNAAATGVHGAGANTLLHSGSTIDGGSFT